MPSSRPSPDSPCQLSSPSAITGSHKTSFERFILVQTCPLANPPSANSPGKMGLSDESQIRMGQNHVCGGTCDRQKSHSLLRASVGATGILTPGGTQSLSAAFSAVCSSWLPFSLLLPCPHNSSAPGSSTFTVEPKPHHLPPTSPPSLLSQSSQSHH